MEKSDKIQKFEKFYNKYYKIIHHLFNIPLFFGIMVLMGNKEFITQPEFTLFGLVVCYLITKFVIKIVDSWN